MQEIKQYKVKKLPSKPVPNAIFYVKADKDVTVSTFITDIYGTPIPFSSGSTFSGVETINNSDGTLEITGVNNIAIKLSPELTALINSAMQRGDNISNFLNDEGYITTANLPKTKTEFNTSLTDGNFLFVGDVLDTPDATVTTKGILKLAGDLGGTADNPTTPTAIHKIGDEIKQGILTLSDGLKIVGNTTSTTATKINVQENDGTINTISKSDLVNVVEVNDVSSLPLIGVAGKLYITKDNNKIYTWNGTFYSEFVGAKGDKGDQGIQGIQGLKGDTGLTGLKGDKGDVGLTGSIGLTGAKGDKGDIGLTGLAGTNGLDGAKGDTGAKGDKGDQGIQGFKGDTGAKGDTGSFNGDLTADQVTETATRKFQTPTQSAYNDATSSIQTQLNSKQDNLGFTPENVANKQNSLTVDGTGIKYPTVDSVNGVLATKANISGQIFTGAISATNISGTNTGDETTSSIQTKRPLKTVDGKSLEGTGNIEIDYNTVINKPIEFPPSAHTHTVSEITDFPTFKTIENQSIVGAGNIDLNKSDVGLSNVDNTSDVNKPVSTAQQTALDLKANLESPAFTGTPIAPTAPAGTNTTQIATTAFVQSAAVDISGKENKSDKGQADGYVPLNALVKIASTYLDIVNDLVTGGANSLLSAEQGKQLQLQVSAINSILFSDNVNLDTVQEIVDAIETIQTSLETILVNDLTTGGITKALTAEMGKSLKALIDEKRTLQYITELNNKVGIHNNTPAAILDVKNLLPVETVLTGTFSFNGMMITGNGTLMSSELQRGDVIKVVSTGNTYKLDDVIGENLAFCFNRGDKFTDEVCVITTTEANLLNLFDLLKIEKNTDPNTPGAYIVKLLSSIIDTKGVKTTKVINGSCPVSRTTISDNAFIEQQFIIDGVGSKFSISFSKNNGKYLFRISTVQGISSVGIGLTEDGQLIYSGLPTAVPPAGSNIIYKDSNGFLKIA